MGVMVKPTILEKQKYEHRRYSLETNPNLATGSIEIVKNTNYKYLIENYSSIGFFLGLPLLG